MRLKHLELKPISSKNVQIIPFCFNSATLAAVNDFLTVRLAFHTLYGLLAFDRTPTSVFPLLVPSGEKIVGDTRVVLRIAVLRMPFFAKTSELTTIRANKDW